MKITIFSDNVAPYRIAWAEELAKGNEVTFVYTKEKDSERNDDWLVKNSKRVLMVKLPALVVRNRAITFNVVKYIKEHESDVIIFDGYGVIPNILGILFLKRKHRLYYVNIDGIKIGFDNSKIKRNYKRNLLVPYARLLCGSNYCAEHFVKLGVNRKNICVHNFSSLHKSDIRKEIIRDDEKQNLKLSLNLADRKTVLAVGRFLALKQFDMLIRAFVPLDSTYQLVIIGEGDQKIKYQEIINEFGLKNVIILDFMRYDDLVYYYMASDLFVLTSNSEVWGLVINEAMSFGLPVIATDRCVASYSLINGNGYVIHYNDEKALSLSMNEILSDDGLREKMKVKSLELISEYSIENIAQTHLKFFQEE